MVLMFLITIGILFLTYVVDGIDFLSLPIDMVYVVLEVAKYGIWVLGADLFLILLGTLAAILSIRMLVAVINFVLSYIPTMSPK